jgi:hypothetical protein
MSTFISPDQLRHLFALLDSFLPENAPPMEKLEKIINNESESEIQIHHLKKHLQAEINQKNRLAQKSNN